MAVQRRMKVPALLLILSAIGACITLNPLGIITWIGAVKMKRLQSRGLAIAGAASALLPLALGYPLGAVAGVWALILLWHPSTRAAFDAVRDAHRSPVFRSR